MAFKYNKRDFDGILPNVSQPGKNFLEDLVNVMNGRTGLATIALGTSSVVVTTDRELNGKPILLTLQGQDATALYARGAVWSAAPSGNFTINVNANTTAALIVAWEVLGR